MENMTARMPLQDLRIVVTAILIQKESGGNLAEVLEKVAHVIRERFASNGRSARILPREDLQVGSFRCCRWCWAFFCTPSIQKR